MSDTTPATETANTPGPGDSSGSPSNPPDAQQAESTQANQQGGTTQHQAAEDATIEQAYDPSQPVYTGEDEDDGKGKGSRKGTRKSTSKRAAKKSEPEATVKQGNSAKQTPPK